MYVFALPLFLILASQIECRTKYIHTTSNNSESFSDQNSMDHATMMKISRYKTKYNKPIFLYTEENKFSSESDKSVTRKISHENQIKREYKFETEIRKSNIYKF